MIGNFIINPAYRIPERFFVEKLAEQIFPRTLDSYRVRLNNPKASLAEVKYVLTDFHHNKIRHFDKTVKPVLDEALAFLDGDDTLVYDKVDKAYYVQLLKDSKQDDYLSLFYATNAVLKVNHNYLERVCGIVEVEIGSLVALPPPFATHQLIRLDGLIEFLATELVNSGYSKSYLFRTVLRRFGDTHPLSFTIAYQRVKDLSTRPAESYDVIFRLVRRPSGAGNINMHDPHTLETADIEPLKQLNAKAAGFFRRKTPYSTFLKITAVRHLRLGSEASELEQIFINYWIGLEYIFSNYDAGESTINRLKEGFVNAHAISYLKRNLIELSRDIERLGLRQQIPGFNVDLQFLKQEATYNHIMATFLASHPLLAFRAYQFKRLLNSNERMKEAIVKHRTNLERHLTRCYRVRNEIVHDAAIHLNIGAITANLKYYLTFVINDIIAFLTNSPMDLNLSGRISIEDYFIYQSIRMKGLEKAGLSFARLSNEESVTAVFTE